MAGTLAYAVTQLTINNSGIVPVQANIAFIVDVSSTTDCALAAPYVETLGTINWGTLNVGDNLRYFCIKNQGNADHPVTTVVSLLDKGTVAVASVLPAGAILSPGETALFAVTWTITSTTLAGSDDWVLTIS